MKIAETVKFLKLMQMTRAQPQYGYVIAGIQKAELSDLAQHHYLVAFTAWHLTRLIKQSGGKINAERVLEICLLHDLGELFGGDIAMSYAKANPAARKLAKAFERENQLYLAKMLGDGELINTLFSEAEEPKSDEGQVAKIADYIEVTHYKEYVGRRTAGDIRLVKGRMLEMAGKVKDNKTRQFLKKFLNEWAKVLSVSKNQEVFEAFK